VLCTTSASFVSKQDKSTINERHIPADENTCGGDLARVNATTQAQAEQKAQVEHNLARLNAIPTQAQAEQQA
jgi:hypothetical protein